MSIQMEAPTTAAEITAANVRMAAARRGWKQSDLARAIGMSLPTVNIRWNGKRQWQLEDLDKVATVLGTTPWALVTPAPGDEWEPYPLWDSNPRPSDYRFKRAAAVVVALASVSFMVSRTLWR